MWRGAIVAIMVRVLDLDLDFFLNGAAHYVQKSDKRLSDDEYRPWTDKQVRDYLEKHLKLRTDKKIPAILCVNHDEVLYHCEKLICEKWVAAPFDLVHVDAHADMGMGSDAWVEILELASNGELVKRQFRTNCFEKADYDNYVSYMLLLRMLASLTYVYNADGGDDVFSGFLCDGGKKIGVPVWPGNEEGFEQTKKQWLSDVMSSMHDYQRGDGDLEPVVPFEEICADAYCESGKYDWAFLAQSPNFTPKASDRLISVVGDYLDFSVGLCMTNGTRFAKARELYKVHFGQ